MSSPKSGNTRSSAVARLSEVAFALIRLHWGYADFSMTCPIAAGTMRASLFSLLPYRFLPDARRLQYHHPVRRQAAF
jgi:hypothetical protein